MYIKKNRICNIKKILYTYIVLKWKRLNESSKSGPTFKYLYICTLILQYT